MCRSQVSERWARNRRTLNLCTNGSIRSRSGVSYHKHTVYAHLEAENRASLQATHPRTRVQIRDTIAIVGCHHQHKSSTGIMHFVIANRVRSMIHSTRTFHFSKAVSKAVDIFRAPYAPQVSSALCLGCSSWLIAFRGRAGSGELPDDLDHQRNGAPATRVVLSEPGQRLELPALPTTSSTLAPISTIARRLVEESSDWGGCACACECHGAVLALWLIGLLWERRAR